MIDRRFFLLGATGLLVGGCETSANRNETAFLEKATIVGFDVDASQATLLGVAKEFGAGRLEQKISAAVNSNLRGLGRGPQQTQIKLAIDNAYVYRRAPDSIIGVKVSTPPIPGGVGVFGRISANAGSDLFSDASAEQAVDRAIAQLVTDLRKHLEKS